MCPVLRGAEAALDPSHGVWVSFPELFEPGMRVTLVMQDEARRELWRAQSEPLFADSLPPIFGPGWTPYAFTS